MAKLTPVYFWSADGTGIRKFDTPDSDVDYCAHCAADEYYSNCDGWESWRPQSSVRFTFYDKHELEIARRNISLEHEPAFYVDGE